jgi:Serpentine type 7TM GPCR chemoreceptor Srt
MSQHDDQILNENDSAVLSEERRAFVHSFRFSNNFTQWPSWSYEDYRWVYCDQGYTIPGKRNLLIGSIYMAQYFLYLLFYAPALCVIAQPPLIHQASYKIMLCLGVVDNAFGLACATFMAGVLSMMGANYCDNTRLLIYVGHVGHGLWFTLCACGVLLAFNRYIELTRPHVGRRLFAGNRTWWWMLLPVIYGVLGSSSVDLPPIYNSVWFVYLFQITLSKGAAPVVNWTCFLNSCWVMTSMVLFYSLLLCEIHRRAKWADCNIGTEMNGVVGVMRNSSNSQAFTKAISRREMKIQLQCFLICLLIFLPASMYAFAGFIPIPLPLLKIATIALQLCGGQSSLLLLSQ